MIIDTEASSPSDVTPRTPEEKAIHGDRFIEKWLHDHLTTLALVVTAAGFVARIFTATKSYLNPDEALHYLLINQPSLFLAYKASLTNAHPPLVYLVLYFWHFLGRSELVLRLPLIFAGTAFCWFMFKWIQVLFGESASLIALIVVAFSPTLITLSAEVRQYALLLFCMTAALYFLERALKEKSLAIMWLFSIFLYLAILSHYSAAFFCLATGIYALARIADSGWPRKLASAWAIGQLGGVAIYVLLYVTHISKIRNSISVWATPFGNSFYRFDQWDIFHFTRKNTWSIFQYMFVQRYVAGAMLIGFIAGVAIFFFREFMPAPRNQGSRHIGIQLLLPFAAVWAAAIAGIYPYVGSRHTIVLAPFAIAAASFLFAAICRQKLWAAILVASLLAGISNSDRNRPEPGIAEADQRRELMSEAIDYLHQSAPEGDLILTDMQGSLPLTYYYCGPEKELFKSWSQAGFDQFTCNGHVIVTLHFWLLRPDGLDFPFEKVVHKRGLKPGKRVWVFQAGWGGDLLTDLPLLPQFRCVTPRTFGKNITIVPLMVGPDLKPVPQTNCSN